MFLGRGLEPRGPTTASQPDNPERSARGRSRGSRTPLGGSFGGSPVTVTYDLFLRASGGDRTRLTRSTVELPHQRHTEAWGGPTGFEPATSSLTAITVSPSARRRARVWRTDVLCPLSYGPRVAPSARVERAATGFGRRRPSIGHRGQTSGGADGGSAREMNRSRDPPDEPGLRTSCASSASRTRTVQLRRLAPIRWALEATPKGAGRAGDSRHLPCPPFMVTRGRSPP